MSVGIRPCDGSEFSPRERRRPRAGRTANEAKAPLIRGACPDGETRLVDLDQLVGATAAAQSIELFVAELAEGA
jgi:hypothetical protein